MTATDRPTPRARTPRPAPDEHIDPVANHPTNDTKGLPRLSGPFGPPKVGRPGSKGAPEATVQLNSRVSTDAASLVEAVQRETGWTKRTVIEHAIRSTYTN